MEIVCFECLRKSGDHNLTHLRRRQPVVTWPLKTVKKDYLQSYILWRYVSWQVRVESLFSIGPLEDLLLHFLSTKELISKFEVLEFRLYLLNFTIFLFESCISVFRYIEHIPKSLNLRLSYLFIILQRTSIWKKTDWQLSHSLFCFDKMQDV